MQSNYLFPYDRSYLNFYEEIKKDPYRYVLSDKEYEKCFARKQRFLFSASIIGGYLYYNIRYHQELGLVRGLKLSPNFYYQCLPKVALFGFLSYTFGHTFFVDYDKKKKHQIAKLELQKFDPEWFTFDDQKYVLRNQPLYSSSDNKFGSLNPIRGFFSYFQEAGYISRLRQRNKDIINDVPPKYEFTPKAPREGEDFEKNKNIIPKCIKRS